MRLRFRACRLDIVREIVDGFLYRHDPTCRKRLAQTIVLHSYRRVDGFRDFAFTAEHLNDGILEELACQVVDILPAPNAENRGESTYAVRLGDFDFTYSDGGVRNVRLRNGLSLAGLRPFRRKVHKTLQLFSISIYIQNHNCPFLFSYEVISKLAQNAQ